MAIPLYSENPAVAKSTALRESGQVMASLSLLHVLCDQEPANAAAWHQLGIGYVQAGKLDHARRCLQQAADLAPDNLEIASHLANIFVLQKDMETAIRQGKKLVAMGPGFAEFHLFLGHLYISEGRMDEALPCICAVLELAPDTVIAHIALARIRLAIRQLAQAREAVSNALRLEPGNAPALQVLGHIERVQRDADEP